MFNKKTITVISATTFLIISLLTTSAQAIYQAKPGATPVSLNNGSTLNIRRMEESGQVMGLSATINTSTLSDTPSNNIDVHMSKPSEWTGVLILGRSSYGLGTGILNTAPSSTTGNNYGVMDPSKQIVTARIWSGTLPGSGKYNCFGRTGNWPTAGTSEMTTGPTGWFPNSAIGNGPNGFLAVFGNNSSVFLSANPQVTSAASRAAVVNGTGR